MSGVSESQVHILYLSMLTTDFRLSYSDPDCLKTGETVTLLNGGVGCVSMSMYFYMDIRT